MTRPWTEDRRSADGSTTITMKRACNGCGQRLGDVTDGEMARAVNGLPLPDVRRECPACGPTAPEPRCLPTKVLAGERDCLDGDCDHEHSGEGGADGLDESYCDEVTEEAICGTHSEISSDGGIVHAEPWPCTHTAVTG